MQPIGEQALNGNNQRTPWYRQAAAGNPKYWYLKYVRSPLLFIGVFSVAYFIFSGIRRIRSR
jgi:hypothetical protein